MRLGVNIDHVATLRQQRRGRFPNPLAAALTAEASGADSIVAHLREDRRHIQEADVRALRENLRIPLALEMAATEAMERFALDVAPVWACLVPEKRQELTTEGGLDVVGRRGALEKTVRRLSAKGIQISLFVDPDENQIRCAQEIGAQAVELHTGRYADASGPTQCQELAQLEAAAKIAAQLKLGVHAGHGLDYQNVPAVARIPGMTELNIGFSIMSAALFTGLAGAVRDMKRLIECAGS